jgi:YD repeat-containing protein
MKPATSLPRCSQSIAHSLLVIRVSIVVCSCYRKKKIHGWTVRQSSGPMTYVYDSASNRAVLFDINSGRTTYTHDIQNRLVEIWNTVAETTLITYDPLDRERSKHVASSRMGLRMGGTRTVS